MEDQVPASQPPVQISPEQLDALKSRAREAALQQTLAQQLTASQQPKIVYLRRNLTVAELILVFVISCGIVTGIQWTWGVLSNVLPRIEVKVR